MERVRVRIASGYQKETYKVQVLKGTTVKGFKQDVADTFGWPRDSDFGISLNKKVEISMESDSLLSDVGICSGDLVWILRPPLSQGSLHQADNTSYEAQCPTEDGMECNPASSTTTVEKCPDEGNIQLRNSASVSQNPISDSCQVIIETHQDGDAHPHNTYIPWELRESLAALTTHNMHSVVVATLHAAFTELGYILSTPLNSFLRGLGGVYAAEYSFDPNMLVSNPDAIPVSSPQEPPTIPSTHLKCAPMAQFLTVIMGVEDGFASRQWTISCSDHVTVQPDGTLLLRNWHKLWRESRQLLGIATTSDIAMVSGTLPKTSLLSLPIEAKELIVKKLDVQSLLSVCQSCKDLNCIGSSDQIWGPIYAREYGASPIVTVGFKRAFQSKYANGQWKSRNHRKHPFLDEDPHPYPNIVPWMPRVGVPGYRVGGGDLAPNLGVMPGAFGGHFTGGNSPSFRRRLQRPHWFHH